MSYGIRDAKPHRQVATPSPTRRTRGIAASIAALAATLATALWAAHDARFPSPRPDAPVSETNVAADGRAGAKNADGRAYAFRAEGDAAFSADVGGGVARVDGTGVSWAPRDGAVRATFTTRRYGCEDALASVTRVSRLRADGNRAIADDLAGSAKLEEWAVSGRAGLEQGWNLDAIPCAGGQLEIEIGVKGLALAARTDGSGVDLRDARGATRLHYGKLSAHDADGATLGTRMLARGDAIVLAVDARHAKFPVMVDPLMWPSPTQLIANDYTSFASFPGGGLFGISVSMSGRSAIVGAYNADNAYVCTEQSNGTWEQDELNGDEGSSFGNAVAISGNLAVVGGDSATVTELSQGAVYVYALQGGAPPFGSWNPVATLTASDATAYAGFGSSVAISGTTIAVGALFAGEAYVFTSADDGMTWTQSAPILKPTDTNGNFGNSVALSGNTLVVGEPGGNGGSGDAYVYQLSDSTPVQQQVLTPPASDARSGLNFGTSVATNGTNVFVGAPPGDAIGSVYTYAPSGNGWGTPTKFQPADGVIGGQFGFALSTSGNLLAATQLANSAGLYVFSVSNGALTQLLEAASPDGDPNGEFGISVSLDSNNLIVGADGYTYMGVQSGEAYVGPVALTNGSACTDATLCSSGFCADSVCCTTACTDPCATCASGTGTCAAAPAHSAGNPSCGAYVCNGTSTTCPTSCLADTDCANAYYCGGDEACHARLAQGAACNVNVSSASLSCEEQDCRQCTSDNCADGVCCSSSQCGTCEDCSGTAQAPGGTNGSCSPTAVDTDPRSECGPSSTCNGAGACGLKDGQSSTSANDCASGFLAGGVCCHTSCSGACDVCTGGTCSPAPQGYGGSPSCGSGVACDGTHTTCPGTACTSDSSCVAGDYCGSGGTCQPQKAQGTACNTGAQGDCLDAGCRECSNGESCVDGVCCGSTSCPTCEVCAAGLQAPGGTNGSCSPALASSNPNGSCGDGGVMACNGAMSCALENGQAATSAAACISGHVADGVCCDQACNAACDVCTTALGATTNGTCKTLACDAGASDASSDAQVSDASAADAGARDAQAEAGNGSADAAVHDASLADAAATNGSDASATSISDAAPVSGDASGYFERTRPSCSCRTAGRDGAGSRAGSVAGLALLALAVGRRRRRDRGVVRAPRRPRTARWTTLVPWVVLGLVASARTASADTDEQRATARALATEGYKAFQEQRWADAVDRFRRAESLVHAPPHLLYLARSYVHLGKLVAAHETYEKLTRDVIPPSASRVVLQAQADGAKELSELDPRVPSLTITIAPEAAGANASVTIDGAAIASVMIGAPIPIDPGPHAIDAKASGFLEGRKTVSVAEASHGSTTIELRPAPPEAVATGGADAEGNAAGASNGPPANDRRSGTSSSGMRVAGYVTAAVAVVAAGAGIAFVLESHHEVAAGNGLCAIGTACPDTEMTQIDSLNSKATLFGRLGIAAFATAGAAAVTGVTLIVLSSGKSGKEPAALWIGPGSAGVRGTF